MDERLISLFEEELRHLRETAREFARAFPSQAQHLDPKSRPFDGLVADPYVERLLEGVAFLAARVRLKLDAQFPQFTQGLIETVYPDFLAPIPSMAVFQLEPDPTAPPPPAGLVVGAKTAVFGVPSERPRGGPHEPTPCTFRLGHEVRLLPVQLTQADWLVRRLHEADLPAAWNARSALRLRLRKQDPAPWGEFALDPLVVYVPRNEGLVFEILEQLFARQVGLSLRDVRARGRTTVLEARGQPVRKFGYEPSTALLPVVSRSFEGHRLLREYFAIPDRFFFFQLTGFQPALAQCQGEEIELLIGMESESSRLEVQVKPGCFRLFCVPAVNLFERQFSQVIEPDRYAEFHLVPDANRPGDFEVYSIESVEGFSDGLPHGQSFEPFFASHHARRDGQAFYTVARHPRSRSSGPGRAGEPGVGSYAGSEVFLALVDPSHAPFDGDVSQLSITALLTNRHLPVQLSQVASRWTLGGGIKAIATPLVGPTAPAYRPVDGAHAWRLLNLFSVNYFSLSDSEEKPDLKENHLTPGTKAPQTLQELLGLYAVGAGEDAMRQVAALRSVAAASVSRPLCESDRPGAPLRVSAIVRGIEIALTFDESAFLDQGVIVLGSVLEEYFARHAAINSFTETVLKTPDGRLRMRWPVRPGLKPVA